MVNLPINPKKEILIVRHSYLNGNNLNLDDAVENTLTLEKHTNGRKVIPCFEGDLLQLADQNEIILTHRNFFSPSRRTYDHLRTKSIATSLQEICDKFVAYKEKNPQQSFFLCLEPKLITKPETIYQTINLLKQSGLAENVYFDSFIGARIADVHKANQKYGTNCPTSLHLMANFSETQFRFSNPEQFDFITVPKKVSFGELNVPFIYGAVGSSAELTSISENPLLIGAYYRASEHSATKMFLNSVSNTVRLRRNYVLSF